MTRLFVFAIAMTAIIFYSGCSEDEPETTPSLIGDWKATGLDAEVEFDVVVLGFPVTTTSDVTGSNFDYNVSFTETAINTNGSYDLTISTTVPGQGTESETRSFTDVTGNAAYTLDGDKLTITGSIFDLNLDGIDLDALSNSQELTVTFDDSDNVTFKQTQEFETSNPTTGDIKITVVSTAKLIRQ